MENVFKEFEGMTPDMSTVEQRHEIYDLLKAKGLIFSPLDSDKQELISNGLYFSATVQEFNISYHPGCVDNIPYEDFKQRIAQIQ